MPEVECDDERPLDAELDVRTTGGGLAPVAAPEVVGESAETTAGVADGLSCVVDGGTSGSWTPAALLALAGSNELRVWTLRNAHMGTSVPVGTGNGSSSVETKSGSQLDVQTDHITGWSAPAHSAQAERTEYVTLEQEHGETESP